MNYIHGSLNDSFYRSVQALDGFAGLLNINTIKYTLLGNRHFGGSGWIEIYMTRLHLNRQRDMALDRHIRNISLITKK